MAEWLASGRLVDAILVLVAVEAAFLFALRRRFRWSTAGVLANLAAGAFLLLALRGALTGAAAHWIMLALAAALVAHLADLKMR